MWECNELAWGLPWDRLCSSSQPLPFKQVVARVLEICPDQKEVRRGLRPKAWSFH